MSKNVLPNSVQTPYLPLRGSKLPRFMGDSRGPRLEICETWALPIPMVPRFHQSISKESYGHGESKNGLANSVQTPYLPLRRNKLPHFMGGSIGPRMEICKTSTLPIPMVPHFHQISGYIKRKLRAWRVQKCIVLVGEDTVLITAWPQSTSFHGG